MYAYQVHHPEGLVLAHIIVGSGAGVTVLLDPYQCCQTTRGTSEQPLQRKICDASDFDDRAHYLATLCKTRRSDKVSLKESEQGCFVPATECHEEEDRPCVVQGACVGSRTQPCMRTPLAAYSPACARQKR